jgi:hypothetical protein
MSRLRKKLNTRNIANHSYDPTIYQDFEEVVTHMKERDEFYYIPFQSSEIASLLDSNLFADIILLRLKIRQNAFHNEPTPFSDPESFLKEHLSEFLDKEGVLENGINITKLHTGSTVPRLIVLPNRTKFIAKTGGETGKTPQNMPKMNTMQI